MFVTGDCTFINGELVWTRYDFKRLAEIRADEAARDARVRWAQRREPAVTR
jgi:hypothetical protein